MKESKLLVAILLVAAMGMPGAWAQSLETLAQPHTGRSMRESSARRLPSGAYDPGSNGDNGNVAPGAVKVLADLEGPGVITHLWMTFLGPEPHPWAKQGSANHQAMLLRIFWDGRDRPDVEAPVGEFFACGFGERMEVKSLPVIVDDGDSYNCFWHMPFRESARIEIVNQSTKSISLLYYNVDWVQRPVAPETPYFCARYNQAYPTKLGEDYVVLDAKGKGHYVGTALFVRTRSPMWFGEGDEKIYVDGEETASIWGTGTEDYFLAAWGLRENSTPYFGTPLAETWGVLGQRTAAYRWHVADPLVFNTGLRFTFEHYGWIPVDENPEGECHSWNEREDDFASVAFWYQDGPSIPFGYCPSAAERCLPSLDWAYYGRDGLDGTHHGPGEGVVQKGGLWPEGQAFFRPNTEDEAWFEVPVTVPVHEPRRLILRLTQSYDYGIYQASFDGVPVGRPIDLYAEETGVKEFPLLDFWPGTGAHTLRLECVGKNEKSTGIYLGVDAVLLRERRPRVKDYGYDKDRDWKTDPVLYR